MHFVIQKSKISLQIPKFPGKELPKFHIFPNLIMHGNNTPSNLGVLNSVTHLMNGWDLRYAFLQRILWRVCRWPHPFLMSPKYMCLFPLPYADTCKKETSMNATLCAYWAHIHCLKHKHVNCMLPAVTKGHNWHIREVPDSRTWGIFIRDTAYFIVIQWSIRSYFIESQWNMPYPVWKCLMYGSLQLPYWLFVSYTLLSWVSCMYLTCLCSKQSI